MAEIQLSELEKSREQKEKELRQLELRLVVLQATVAANQAAAKYAPMIQGADSDEKKKTDGHRRFESPPSKPTRLALPQTEKKTENIHHDLTDMEQAVLCFRHHIPGSRERSSLPSGISLAQSTNILFRTKFFLKSVIHDTHRTQDPGITMKIGFDNYQIPCGTLNQCECEKNNALPHFYYSVKGLPTSFTELDEEEQKRVTEEEKSLNTVGSGNSVIWRHEKNQVRLLCTKSTNWLNV